MYFVYRVIVKFELNFKSSIFIIMTIVRVEKEIN
jgi:hypothetical protein